MIPGIKALLPAISKFLGFDVNPGCCISDLLLFYDPDHGVDFVLHSSQKPSAEVLKELKTHEANIYNIQPYYRITAHTPKNRDKFGLPQITD